MFFQKMASFTVEFELQFSLSLRTYFENMDINMEKTPNLQDEINETMETLTNSNSYSLNGLLSSFTAPNEKDEQEPKYGEYVLIAVSCK